VVKVLLAIALGSGLGGVMRYLGGALVHAWWPRAFPWGTLSVNVLGSALIGLAWVWLAARGAEGEMARAFVIVGFLGGFTTFSSFSLETLVLAEQQGPARAVAYVAASVLLCLAGAWAGLRMGRHWLA